MPLDLKVLEWEMRQGCLEQDSVNNEQKAKSTIYCIIRCSAEDTPIE